ncbi:hypothetical protein [Agriterribacter sp.]|uniref:hypothetical protein n=1 Tax=Agriterribacter sp. TaxID=2821509 RepID=UPI002D096BAA|nr:hypothetical protein [Agriterribacter sp.]HRO47907.1 hypothetical protein [Agriterribacter sp.]HRQ15936.1 hypothetical protein [Agriterribacter sp.]
MTNWKIIGFFFAGTIFFLLLLQIQGKQLVTPLSPSGILSLEFSYRSSHTQSIVNAWESTLRGTFRINMLLDFLLIPFYGLFLYSTCGYFSVHYQTGWAQRLGVLLAFGSLLAMFFDMIENIAMSFSVHFSATAFTSAVTTTMAVIKFLLIGLALVYIILSAALMLFRKKQYPSA